MNSSFTEVSPDLMRAVFDNSLTSIYAAQAVRDQQTGELLDFQIFFCNPAFCQRVRRTEAEIQTQTLRTLFPTLDRTGFFDRYRQVVDTGVPFEGEQEHPGPNGHFWYQTSVKKWDDGIIVNFIDTTERKRAELQVQRTNDQLQATLDASISSIIAMTAIRNEAGEIVDFMMDKANRAVERSLGKTPAELEGRTLLSVYPGNVESGFFALYTKAADTGEAQQATFHYTDVNGYEGWFEASAVRIPSVATVPDQIVLTFMNVTEYKLAEGLVRRQADLVNSVLNATLTAVATYEAVHNAAGQVVDFRFTLANQASLAMLGLPAEVLYTKTICELNPPLRGSEAFAGYVAVIETGDPATMERLIGDR